MDLTEFISLQAIEFKLDALDVLRGPGVYLYCAGDEALYIGASRKVVAYLDAVCASRKVVGRVLARNHHIGKDLQSATSLLIFPCKDWQSAKALESKLIGDLKPRLNMRNGALYRARQVSEALGVSPHRIVNAYLSKNPA